MYSVLLMLNRCCIMVWSIYRLYPLYLKGACKYKIRAIGIILEYYLFDVWDIFMMHSQYLRFSRYSTNSINARNIRNFHVTFCVSCISWTFRTISPIWQMFWTLKLQFFHPVTRPDAALGIFDLCFWSLPRFSFEDLSWHILGVLTWYNFLRHCMVHLWMQYFWVYLPQHYPKCIQQQLACIQIHWL